MKCNTEIRNHLKELQIPQWMLAEQLGQSEGTFCRRMRHEFSEAETKRVLLAIQELSKKFKMEDIHEGE